jgi:eukaryotic-like serine/threonine-protein kinase
MNVVLRVTAGPYQGKEYVFRRHETFVVGRSSQAQFSVPDDGFLSRNHFLIEFNPPVCFLRDLGSTNGTKVNGVRIEATRLRDSDLITAGESAFVVRVEDTWTEFPVVHCLGCGQGAPRDTAMAAMPGDQSIDWLCDACIDHRRKYPTPPPDYWIEKRIGGGGMGEVFMARHMPSNRPVAIKMMIPTVAASDRAKAYFRRELEVLKNLRHANIVSYHGMQERDGQFLLIMEYVDGKNAREWVDSLPGPLTIQAAARIGVQLLSALEHAHEKGYVHRDIKPSNLLVMGPPLRPTVKLSDFGLAKSFRDNAGFAGLTHQGDVGGSIGFLSPDHIRDFREVKEPADIYSAGATLYYLLSGNFPFLDFDPNRSDAYTMILEHPPVPLRAHRPDAPEAFDNVLRKALEKQPRERWKSAAAMAKALKPFAEGAT